MKSDSETTTGYAPPSRQELAGGSWRAMAADKIRELLGGQTLEDDYRRRVALPAAAQEAANRASREAAWQTNGEK